MSSGTCSAKETHLTLDNGAAGKFNFANKAKRFLAHAELFGITLRGGVYIHVSRYRVCKWPTYGLPTTSLFPHFFYETQQVIAHDGLDVGVAVAEAGEAIADLV